MKVEEGKATQSTQKTNGPAAAAILSAGIGCFIFGLSIVLAVVSPGIKNLLNWYNPAGPLSGKAGVGVISWIVTWIVLSLIWKKNELNMKTILVISFILIGLGFLGSFPPFFEAFEPHK